MLPIKYKIYCKYDLFKVKQIHQLQLYKLKFKVELNSTYTHCSYEYCLIPLFWSVTDETLEETVCLSALERILLVLVNALFTSLQRCKI